jgi:hypothetical protein
MRCPNCGGEVNSSDSSCGKCAYGLTPGEPPAATNPPPIDGAAPIRPVAADNLIPGTSIALGDGETVWRSYDVTQLRSREQGRGTLYVTDSRVIFYATAKAHGPGRSSALIQETRLADVSGLSAYVSRSVSLLLVSAMLMFGVVALIALLDSRIAVFVTTGLITALLIWLLVSGVGRKGSVGVRIHSGSTQASPIGFGQFGEEVGFVGAIVQRLAGPLLLLVGAPTAFDVLLGMPADDAERVITELGALIIDLQSKGSLAGTHWGVAVS